MRVSPSTRQWRCEWSADRSRSLTVADAILPHSCVVGCFLTSLLGVTMGRPGARYHIGFPVLARTSFGVKGSKIMVGSELHPPQDPAGWTPTSPFPSAAFCNACTPRGDSTLRRRHPSHPSRRSCRSCRSCRSSRADRSVRGCVAVIWYAVQTYYGASLLDQYVRSRRNMLVVPLTLVVEASEPSSVTATTTSPTRSRRAPRPPPGSCSSTSCSG
jgi:hypothetical protein